MLYFYQRLNVPTEAVEYIRKQLLPTGADISDACCFALLHTQLGISLPQIQTCLNAFPTLTFCDLDPGWELLTTTTTTTTCRNPIRTQFNEDALHYLRKRLQIGTSDIFAMIKVRYPLYHVYIDITLSLLISFLIYFFFNKYIIIIQYSRHIHV